MLTADKPQAETVPELHPLKSRVKEYPRYQFAYDLSLLIVIERQAEGLIVKHDDRRLTFHQASKSAAGSRDNSVKVEHGRETLPLSDLEISG